MIKFTPKDTDKYFISIILEEENTSVDTIITNLKSHYPCLQGLHIIFDEEEILIPIEDGQHFNFSLRELKRYIRPLTLQAATVSHFAVDFDEPTQRF